MSMTEIKLIPGTDKHRLEVRLSDVEAQRLGNIEPGKDTSTLLQDLASSGILPFPSIIKALGKAPSPTPPDILAARNTAFRSIMIASGKKVPASVRRPGVKLSVRIVSPQGVYESNPIEGVNIRTEILGEWDVHSRLLTEQGLQKEKTERWQGPLEDEIRKRERLYSHVAQGRPYSDLVGELGESRGTLGNWLAGRYKPRPVGVQIMSAKRREEYNIPAVHSPEFAYLLGVYACTTTGRHNLIKAQSSSDPDLVEYWQKAVKDVFGVNEGKLKVHTYTTRTGKAQANCYLSSEKVEAYMWGITNGGTAVPWEHLVNDDERRAFFRAIVDFHSSVVPIQAETGQYPILTLQYTGRREFVDDLIILASRIGMHPNVRREIKKGKPVDRLEFTGQTNIGALREIGFTSKRKAQRLDELYSQSPYPRGGPEDPKRLRTRQGISDGISKFKPDPDVIGFLFREHKFPGLIARKVAELKNIDEVRTACGQIQALGLSPSKQMDYLMLSPDELRQRLTGKRKDDSRSIPVFNDPRLKFFEAVIRDNPPPPPALERRLIREAKNGDAKASNELANRHLSVVIKTALVYDARLRRKGVNVDIMDLIQTGFLGLNQALDGFDVNHRDKGTKRPVRFSTYSGYRVDGAIKDYLLKEHKLRGISRQDYSDIGQYSKACDYFEAGGDREPSDEKVAARLGWDAERARKARLGFAISKKSVPLMDDIQQAGYSDFLERGLLEETMQEAFRCLAIPDVQRDILYMRFGCGTYNGKTHKLREIGENYQMSPSWARGQIEDLSERLRANRHRPEVKELLDYLGRGDSD